MNCLKPSIVNSVEGFYFFQLIPSLVSSSIKMIYKYKMNTWENIFPEIKNYICILDIIYLVGDKKLNNTFETFFISFRIILYNQKK